MDWRRNQNSRLRRLFLEGFLAPDIAELRISFDADTYAGTVHDFMEKKDSDLVGIREDGLVTGYVRREELQAGNCRDCLRNFRPEDGVLPETANLVDVVSSLATNGQCFVMILGQVAGIIAPRDLEKPPMCLFLLGMITLGEMWMTSIFRHRYGIGSWERLISPHRLVKAEELQQELARRGRQEDPIDCLLIGDKG